MILDKLPPLPVGGAEIQALRLSKELVRKGVQVTFLTPGRDRVKGYGDIDGIPVFRLHSFLNYFWDFFSAMKKKATVRAAARIEYDDNLERTTEVTTPIAISVRLRYLLFYFNSLFFFWKRVNDFDIIHVHSMEWPSFIGAWLCRKFKMQLIIKDATLNGINGLLRYPAGDKKLSTIIRIARFVAMTRAIHTNLIAAGVPEGKIEAISNGIQIDDVVPKTYGNKNRKVIFVGNLSQQPAKGIDILLKAWKMVAQKHKDAILAIAGDGDTHAYDSYLTQHGIKQSVFILGKRTDIKSLLLDSDIFVLPSRREGMPNALMEAMLIGLPCIGTDISGSQDLIEQNMTGVLVPAGSVQKLFEAICYMMENPDEAERMGRHAKEKIIRMYNMEAIADRYVALYRKVLN